MRIYVGNLSRSCTADSIQYLFELYGTVTDVRLMLGNDTGCSHGSAIVIMPNRLEAETAIAQVNGRTFEGRTLRLKEAQTRRKPPRD